MVDEGRIRLVDMSLQQRRTVVAPVLVASAVQTAGNAAGSRDLFQCPQGGSKGKSGMHGDSSPAEKVRSAHSNVKACTGSSAIFSMMTE